MLNNESKAAVFVRNVAVLAVLSLGFVAADALSASAQTRPTVQTAAQVQPAMPRWHRHKAGELYLMHRARPGSGWRTPNNLQCRTVPTFYPEICPQGIYNGPGGTAGVPPD